VRVPSSGTDTNPIGEPTCPLKAVVTAALLASAIATAMAAMASAGPLAKEEAAAVSMLVAGLSAR
jgi:hypothetical protein